MFVKPRLFQKVLPPVPVLQSPLIEERLRASFDVPIHTSTVAFNPVAELENPCDLSLFAMQPNPKFKEYRLPAQLGPLLRFGEIRDGFWSGSVLILLPTGTLPEDLRLYQRGFTKDGFWFKPVLIDSFAGWQFYRYNITIQLTHVARELEYIVKGRVLSFHVPAISENANVAYHSGRGSLHQQPQQPQHSQPQQPHGSHELNQSMWYDLLRQHRESPFHVQIGGGGQIWADGYYDLFEDVAPLKSWLQINDINERLNYQWTPTLEKAVHDFFFLAYAFHFQEDLFADILAAIPYAFICDDHEIFKGFGSFPSSTMNTPVIKNITRIAFKFYLLFQHHTTLSTAADVNLFPVPAGYSWIKRLGPSVCVLGLDDRSTRTDGQVINPECWRVIWGQLDKTAWRDSQLKHLIILTSFPPLSPRKSGSTDGSSPYRLFSNELEQQARSSLQLAFISSGIHINSPLEAFEEWISPFHFEERNNMILSLQEFSLKTKVRVSFISTHQNLCGLGRFMTAKSYNQSPSSPSRDVIDDHRAMYQVLVSPLGDGICSDGLLAALDVSRVQLTHAGIDQTEEEFLPIFRQFSPYSPFLLNFRSWASFRYNVAEGNLAFVFHTVRPQLGGEFILHSFRVPPLK